MTTESVQERRAWLSAYGRWVLRHRWLVVIATTIVGLVLALGLFRLEVNPDSRVFFGKDDPQRIALDRMERTYSKANNVFFVVTAKEGDLFTRRSLAAIEALTRVAWKTPYTLRVDSIANHQHSSSKDDEIVVEPLYKNAGRLTDSQVATVRQRALGSEELRDRLISKGGEVAGINVMIRLPGKRLDEVPTVAAHARALAAQARKDYPWLEIRLSGGIMADMTFKEAGELDLRTLVPVMIAIVLVILWLGFRSIGGTLATVAVIGLSVVTALGAAGWAGVVLNSATSATPIIIMTLCIADCVHIMTTLAQQRKAGLEIRPAIVEAMRINAGPVAITSLTTAIGFLTLNFGDSPPLSQLGTIVAVGMIAAFVYSITFFPAILSVIPSARADRPWTGEALTRRLADSVLRRRRAILLLALVIFGLGSAGVMRLTLDDNFIGYFDERFPFRRDTDYLQERLTGLNVLVYSMPSGREHGVTDPDYLRKVDAFAAWFAKQDGVAHVGTIATLIRRLNKSSHNDDPKFDRIPDDPKLAAQLLLLYELSLPFGRDLKDQIDIRKSASRINVFLAVTNAAEIRRLAEAGEAWLKKNAPRYAAPATGLSVVYAYISAYNVQSMVGGTVIALVLISGILLFVLRSVKLGLLSLVPNLTPVFIAFGLWGYVFKNVNLAVSVVAAITLGIVVDDTVHFLAKYVRARREKGLPPAEAVADTFRTVGNALILTTVALVLGFAVLTISGFAVSAQMGFLSAATLAIALIADLTLLPVLLTVIDREKTPPAEADRY